jgi:hypothetical protein
MSGIWTIDFTSHTGTGPDDGISCTLVSPCDNPVISQFVIGNSYRIRFSVNAGVQLIILALDTLPADDSVITPVSLPVVDVDADFYTGVVNDALVRRNGNLTNGDVYVWTIKYVASPVILSSDLPIIPRSFQ